MTFQDFQEEYKRLLQSMPVPQNHNVKSDDSEYGDHLYQCKNAHYCFDTGDSENPIYIFDSYMANNCCDGDYIIESQNCYECVDTVSSNNCTYLNYTSNLYDCDFCFNCVHSSNLFGCAHLKHQEYCIFNKKYSPEEYKKIVAELKKRPAEENLEELRKLMMKFPVTQTRVTHSENCDYNNCVFHSKNVYLSFDSAHSEDSAYLYDSHRNKNCFDMTQSHRNEYLYESVDATHSNNSIFLKNCDTVYDCGFCEECKNSNHLFGCVGLNNKEYCILNKKYSKEEYDREVREIMLSYKGS